MNGTCEMCGKVNVPLKASKVAGSVMQVCSSCSSYGKDMESSIERSHSFTRKERVYGGSEEVVANFSSILQKGLAKKNYNSHQLARLAAIKESSLQKFLTGKLKPDISTARKLERALDVRLVEEQDSVSERKASEEVLLNKDEKNAGKPSLGDMLLEELRKKEKK